MNRKLLPTMIGVALAGSMAVAQADVTVFGHIDQSFVHFSSGVPSGFDNNSFVCTTCSIGFKGSEDLGNGLKAIFSIDFQYDMNNRNPQTASVWAPTGKTSQGSPTGTTTVKATTNNGITDRDQWLGLAGSFGQVRVGTISTSYKSHGAMLDPGYRTVAQMRDWGIQSDLHSGAGAEGQGRATNTARWDSPDWNGLKATGTYTLNPDQGSETGDNPFGVGVQYSNGGILVFADYLTTNEGDSSSSSENSAWKVGGKYTLDNFSVFAQYEYDDGLISLRNGATSEFGAKDGADVWMLGGSYSMGNNTIYAAYGNGDEADDATYQGSKVDTSYDAWEIVGIHSMSKQTLVYLGYATFDADESQLDEPEGWTMGMKHKF
jgi:predicted porin